MKPAVYLCITLLAAAFLLVGVAGRGSAAPAVDSPAGGQVAVGWGWPPGAGLAPAPTWGLQLESPPGRASSWGWRLAAASGRVAHLPQRTPPWAHVAGAVTWGSSSGTSTPAGTTPVAGEAGWSLGGPYPRLFGPLPLADGRPSDPESTAAHVMLQGVGWSSLAVVLWRPDLVYYPPYHVAGWAAAAAVEGARLRVDHSALWEPVRFGVQAVATDTGHRRLSFATRAPLDLRRREATTLVYLDGQFAGGYGEIRAWAAGHQWEEWRNRRDDPGADSGQSLQTGPGAAGALRIAGGRSPAWSLGVEGIGPSFRSPLWEGSVRVRNRVQWDAQLRTPWPVGWRGRLAARFVHEAAEPMTPVHWKVDAEWYRAQRGGQGWRAGLLQKPRDGQPPTTRITTGYRGGTYRLGVELDPESAPTWTATVPVARGWSAAVRLGPARGQLRWIAAWSAPAAGAGALPGLEQARVVLSVPGGPAAPLQVAGQVRWRLGVGGPWVELHAGEMEVYPRDEVAPVTPRDPLYLVMGWDW